MFTLAVAIILTTFGLPGTTGVFEGPVPRAQCGPGSRPETALQGSVPVADRASGRSAQGYTCNAELVGHYGPARIIPQRQEIWFTDQDRGVYIIRLTNGSWPA